MGTLGINLIFAGFALSLNAVGLKTKLNRNVLAYANLLVGLIILFNSFLGIENAVETVADISAYAACAGGVLFAVNYLMLFATHKFGDDDFKVFGFFELFAGIASILFAAYNIYTCALWVYPVIWFMWAVLWINGFFSEFCKVKICSKLSFWLLLLNGIVSTFAVGFCILFGII